MDNPLEAEKKLVDEVAAKLAEHFDSVQIFVTLHAGGEAVTRSYERGMGNFYARFGQINEWLCIQNQYSRQDAKRRDADVHEGGNDG